jgi:hypothetical protein
MESFLRANTFKLISFLKQLSETDSGRLFVDFVINSIMKNVLRLAKIGRIF